MTQKNRYDLSERSISIIREILSLDDVEDYAREQLEIKDWDTNDFEGFNRIRGDFGLEYLEPYE